MSPSKRLEQLLPRKLAYYDIGARDGLHEPMRSFSALLNVVSFEADEVSVKELTAKKRPGDQVFHAALGEKIGKATLKLTKSRGCSSIYPPNYDFLRDFPENNRFEIEKEIQLTTTTLSHLRSKNLLNDLDLIKLDTQGAELSILKGGRDYIQKNALGIELEVNFQEQYVGQPLFSDVDKYIRQNFGMELFDIRRTYWKYAHHLHKGAKKGKLIFGDAIYMFSPSFLYAWCKSLKRKIASEKIFLAIVIGLMYGYHDYCFAIIQNQHFDSYIDAETKKELQNLVRRDARSIRFDIKIGYKIARVAQLIYGIFQPTHGQWATADSHLGSRKKLQIFS